MSSRPPTDPDGLLAVRLGLAVGRLARRLRQHAAGGLTATQLSTLAAVERHGPVRLGDLAAWEGVSPPTLTRTVASLAECGLLERAVDPADRRVTRVRLTADGRRAVAARRADKATFLRDRLRTLSAGQRATLAGALPALEALAADADRPLPVALEDQP